jgi:hypothetical protein
LTEEKECETKLTIVERRINILSEVSRITRERRFFGGAFFIAVGGVAIEWLIFFKKNT